MWLLSEKRRLILFVSFVLVTGFVLTSVIAFQVSRSAIHDEIVRNQLPLTGDNIYSEIQRDLLRPVFISSVMAQNAFLRDWVVDGERDRHQIRRFLSEIKERYGTVTSFFVSENTRVYYHASGVLKTVSPDDPSDKWYFRVREMDADFEINVDLDAANNNAMTVFVNHKLLDYGGNYIGTTGVGLTVDRIGELISSYRQRFQRTIFFADQDGNIVLPQMDPSAQPLNIRDRAGYADFAEQILGEENGRFRVDVDGQTVFVASRFIPELKWSLVVEQSDADAIGGLKKALAVNLGISLIVTVVVLMLTVLAINAFQRRLEHMAESERRVNQQLNRVSQQKDRMLSIIAHDLRTPFNVLLAFSEQLASKASDLRPDQVRDYAGDVERSARTAYTLLDSLLNWARGQWEELHPDAIEFDLTAVIRANIGLFGDAAEAKDVRFAFDEDQAAIVAADPNMIDLVLRNLIDNAIKFSDVGSEVAIEIESEAESVWVTVRDSGVGIAAERIADMFQAGERVSTEGTRGEAGIGMGLVLCREMVEANGGVISVESPPAGGAVFRFSLPKAADPAAGPAID